MSSKISTLASATDWNAADLMTGVQAGTNKKMTRAVMLKAKIAEVVALAGAGSIVQVAGDGKIRITLDPAADLVLADSVTSFVQTNTAGDLLLKSRGLLSIANTAGGNSISVLASGLIDIKSIGAAGTKVDYLPPVAPIWAGAPPDKLNLAIDRLAQAVFGLLGHAIP